MRRFARWMLNAVTVLCLLALLEVLSNIVSSGWYGAGADVMLWRLSPDVPARSLLEPPRQLFPLPREQQAYGFIWQVVEETDLSLRSHLTRMLTIPAWFIAMVAAILPAMRLYRLLRRLNLARRLRRQPLCASCLYDLTGDVSGVCPECGTKVSSISIVSHR